MREPSATSESSAWPSNKVDLIAQSVVRRDVAAPLVGDNLLDKNECELFCDSHGYLDVWRVSRLSMR